MMNLGPRAIINGFGFIILLSSFQLTLLALKEQPPKNLLTQSDIHSDLHQLASLIEDRSAYGALFPERLSQVHQEIDKLAHAPIVTMNRHEFAAQLVKTLAPLDDISSQVTDVASHYYLPLRLKFEQDNWLVLNYDNRPFDPDFPFLTHIDGLPLQQWIDASHAFLAPSIRHIPTQQARWLQMISLLRQEIGMANTSEVRLTLSNKESSQQYSLPLTRHRSVSRPPESPLSYNNSLEGHFNLYDLSQFKVGDPLESALLRAIHTPITILDLRHAYGRGEQLLRWLAYYYSQQEQTPYSSKASELYAMARYLKVHNQRNDYLKPLEFTAYQKLPAKIQQQIDSASNRIEASFDNQFSQWHGRKLAVTSSMRLFAPETGQLLLLIGPDCRHQCQWIAHFAKDWPKVTLIGEPTLGNLDKHAKIILPKSVIEITLTSSLVYDMRGQRLSGIALEPDILLPIDQLPDWQALANLVSENTDQ